MGSSTSRIMQCRRYVLRCQLGRCFSIAAAKTLSVCTDTVSMYICQFPFAVNNEMRGFLRGLWVFFLTLTFCSYEIPSLKLQRSKSKSYTASKLLSFQTLHQIYYFLAMVIPR
eukprot:IDg19982t1